MKYAIIVHVQAAEESCLDLVSGLAEYFPDASIIAVADVASQGNIDDWTALSHRVENVTFFTLGIRLGKGAAIRAALNRCRADYIALLDADGVVAPRDIRSLFQTLDQRSDIHGIVGYRWRGVAKKQAPKRWFVSAFFATAARLLFSLRIRDPQSPLKVFRRDTLQCLFEDLRLHDRGFDVELLFQCARHGFTVVEETVEWLPSPPRWPVVRTGLRVLAALVYVRLLNSPLKHLPLLEFLGRPHNVPVKRSYSIMIFCWRDPGNPQAGGAEVYLHEQAKCWVARGHRVTWFAQGFSGGASDTEIDGIRVVRRGRFPFVFLFAPLWYVFQSDRSFDFIIDCMNGIPFFTPLYSTKPKVCLLYHVHTHHFKAELPKPLALLAAAVETRITPVVYRNTRFVSISESSKAEIEEYGISRLPVELVYSGVSPQLVPGAKSLRPTILYLGRLKKYKRVRKLIDAFALAHKRLPGAQLVIAGTGDDEEGLRQYVASRGLEGVRFTGRVDDAIKTQLMQEAWIFGMPSSIEGWGIVVIEANACATPAIAYNVAGLRDCIVNNKTGFVVEDDASFADRLIELLTQPELLATMSQNAHDWATHFSWAATAEHTLEKIRRAQPWHAVFEPDGLDSGLWRLVKHAATVSTEEAAPQSLVVK